MNTNIDKFEKYEQLTENKQRLNKRKNTEEFAYVLLKIQQKRNRKEIIKNDNQYSLLNKELWTNNLTKLKTFIDLNERRPNNNKKTEKVMGSWLNTQLGNRKAEKQIMINEDIRGLWDSFIKDYNQYFFSNKELWTNNLTELKIFMDLNERRPSQNKETEKALGKWLSHQLDNRKSVIQIMLNDDIRSLWDNFIKDYEHYFISNEELWTIKLDELKSFIDLNERRPSDIIKTEKALASWLGNQLNNRKTEKYNMLNEDIRGLWDSFIKDYKQYFISNEELWTIKLDELKSFIDLNERQPKKSKKTEKVLGVWVANQLRNRKTEKNNMLNENIRDLWDNFIKDHEQYFISNEELWTIKLDELKSFIDLNERRPSDIKDTEKVLGKWLSHQLDNFKKKQHIMLSEDIRSLWDSFINDYEQYFVSNEESWTIKLDELKAFINLNERRPNKNKETEKVLGIWLTNQLVKRKAKKEIMSNEDVKNTWDNFIKDYKQYFVSNEELWTNKLTELKAFINLNKRRPLVSKETEKVLGGWLANQLTRRKTKTKIMSNEDIRGSWDSFIKNYEQYLISNEQLS